MSSNDKVVYDVLLNYSKIQLNEDDRVQLEVALSKIENIRLFTSRALACHLAPLLHKALGTVQHGLPPNVISMFASAYNQG